MTLSVANVQPAVALQAASVGSVGAVAAAGPVNTPVSVPTGSAPVPQDGVDRVPHADLVLKDVLVHVSDRLAGPLPPLRTPQAQLALAQHRDFGSPFPGLAAALGGPGADATTTAKPGSEATSGPALSRAGADAPAIGAPAGPPALSAAPAAGQPSAAPPAAPPAAGQPAAQAQSLPQSPVAAHASASPPVNPNPPPPPNAAVARQQRQRERWRPRDPQGQGDNQADKTDPDVADTRERDRAS
jgi:hypothetical protein